MLLFKSKKIRIAIGQAIFDYLAGEVDIFACLEVLVKDKKIVITDDIFLRIGDAYLQTIDSEIVYLNEVSLELVELLQSARPHIPAKYNLVKQLLIEQNIVLLDIETNLKLMQSLLIVNNLKIILRPRTNLINFLSTEISDEAVAVALKDQEKFSQVIVGIVSVATLFSLAGKKLGIAADKNYAASYSIVNSCLSTHDLSLLSKKEFVNALLQIKGSISYYRDQLLVLQQVAEEHSTVTSNDNNNNNTKEEMLPQAEDNRLFISNRVLILLGQSLLGCLNDNEVIISLRKLLLNNKLDYIKKQLGQFYLQVIQEKDCESEFQNKFYEDILFIFNTDFDKVEGEKLKKILKGDKKTCIAFLKQEVLGSLGVTLETVTALKMVVINNKFAANLATFFASPVQFQPRPGVARATIIAMILLFIVFEGVVKQLYPEGEFIELLLANKILAELRQKNLKELTDEETIDFFNQMRAALGAALKIIATADKPVAANSRDEEPVSAIDLAFANMFVHLDELDKRSDIGASRLKRIRKKTTKARESMDLQLLEEAQAELRTIQKLIEKSSTPVNENTPEPATNNPSETLEPQSDNSSYSQINALLVKPDKVEMQSQEQSQEKTQPPEPEFQPIQQAIEQNDEPQHNLEEPEPLSQQIEPTLQASQQNVKLEQSPTVKSEPEQAQEHQDKKRRKKHHKKDPKQIKREEAYKQRQSAAAQKEFAEYLSQNKYKLLRKAIQTKFTEIGREKILEQIEESTGISIKK